MQEINKFLISGTIVGITATTKHTTVRIATISFDRSKEGSFPDFRFVRTVDVCGFNVKDNVQIEGYFKQGCLYATKIMYIPRPLSEFEEELGVSFDYKPTNITQRSNKILIAGRVEAVQNIANTPFTNVNIITGEQNVRVTFFKTPKEITEGSEIAVVGFIQSLENATTSYNRSVIDVIDWEVFDSAASEKDKEEQKEDKQDKDGMETLLFQNIMM